MDKYDAEIEQIVEEIGRGGDVFSVIMNHWSLHAAKSPVLFAYCSPDGMNTDAFCGCLTQVKGGRHYVTELDSQGLPNLINLNLTKEIEADARLHDGPEELADAIEACPEKVREILQPYAEWQRRLDGAIRSV